MTKAFCISFQIVIISTQYISTSFVKILFTAPWDILRKQNLASSKIKKIGFANIVVLYLRIEAQHLLQLSTSQRCDHFVNLSAFNFVKAKFVYNSTATSLLVFVLIG